jgi:hypothetical protein
MIEDIMTDHVFCAYLFAFLVFQRKNPSGAASQKVGLSKVMLGLISEDGMRSW